MKTKILVAVAMLMLSTASFAQFSNSGSGNSAGQMAVGVNANYGFASNFKTFGVGAKFQYGFTESFRGEFSGNYFFKKNNVSAWDLNLNVHYLIPVGAKVNVYPILGVTLMNHKSNVKGAIDDAKDMANDFLKSFGISSSDVNAAMKEAMKEYGYEGYAEYAEYAEDAADNASSTQTHFGFNAGGGIEYFISDKFKVNAEMKYQYVKDSDWPVVSIGAAYVF